MSHVPRRAAAVSGQARWGMPAGAGRSLSRAVLTALAAGAVAIAVNIAVLDAFDAAGIVTARGGLQKLVRMWLAAPLIRLGADETWASLGLPGPDTPVFKTGFKVAVGLLMALVYAVLLEPILRGRWLQKGLAAALLFWLVNAMAVLPLLGEGVAGLRTLTAGGLLCYAVAHTTFFLVLAWLYSVLSRRLG
jgi:hypothetical protein